MPKVIVRWVVTIIEANADGAGVASDGNTGGAKRSSEMTGANTADMAGRSPNLGRPYKLVRRTMDALRPP